MNSRTVKFSTLFFASVAFLFSTGFMISPFKVKSNAFGANKTYAVVSIMATSKITTDSQTGGIAGLIKGASKKHSFSKDSSKVFAESVPILMEQFESSKSFQLLGKKSVLQNPSYQAMEPDKPKKWFGVKMVPAEGYKYFKDKKKIKQLAKEMGVDGIMIIAVSYNVAFTGANISGLAGVGKEKGMATVSVYAVDKTGQVVWKHAAQGKGKKGNLSSGGAANFDKLHSGLLEASRRAAEKLIKKLDKKVGT